MITREINEMKINKFTQALIEDEKSKETISKYKREIELFRSFLVGKEICKETVIRYKQYLMARYSPSSVNCKLAAVNRFLREQGGL